MGKNTEHEMEAHALCDVVVSTTAAAGPALQIPSSRFPNAAASALTWAAVSAAQYIGVTLAQYLAYVEAAWRQTADPEPTPKQAEALGAKLLKKVAGKKTP